MIEQALVVDYDGYAFSLANAHMDQSYFMALVGELGQSSAMADEVMAVYEQAMTHGDGARRLSRLLHPQLSQD